MRRILKSERSTLPISELGVPFSDSLLERTRRFNDACRSTSGQYVLYWLRTGMRSSENPALEVAKQAARALQLPLLVYQGLSQSYPFASDRHHAFILQGVTDLIADFRQQGIRYAFHLERPGLDEAYLRQLADSATLVVTEDMPTDPSKRFVSALRRELLVPLLLVDTSCIVPMQKVGKPYDRAFEFRQHTEKLYKTRIDLRFDTDGHGVRPFEGRLPFPQFEPDADSWYSCLAECDIDHSVGPVSHTCGGSLAGYNRWDHFKATGLSKYSGTRNDPLRDGVSRMSAYLHYGMVSPWRLARESQAIVGEGSAKFLDELLIWRELAHAFCFYRPDHDRISALPDWAIWSLRKHQTDHRSKIYSWFDLAHGQTDDSLWNAMQRSLLWNGELHNNARMTWGKALLNWTDSPEEALRLLIDLNHRYALDGRDPASYGGILWCLGQFDRPFEPEQPIVGLVRPRSTTDHARRLDPVQYARRVDSRRSYSRVKLAVVGAGIAGAIAARVLHEQGLEVTVFDKSPGVGGRLATRRIQDTTLDHGAQYFTVRDPVFRTYVDDWLSKQIVDRWSGPFVMLDHGRIERESKSVERFVGVPSMTAMSKELLSPLSLRLNTEVQSVRRQGDSWSLWDGTESALGEFDRVVLAIPSQQAAKLIGSQEELASILQSQTMDPCWMLGVTLESPLEWSWSGAFVQNSPIRWIGRNQTKPGREPRIETLVIHASADWTRLHMDDGKEDVERWLLESLKDSLAIDPLNIVEHTSQRWRYAIPTQSVPRRFLANASETVFACGDWAAGSRVEGAFLSGMAAAGALLRSLVQHTLVQQSAVQPAHSSGVATQLKLFE